MSDPQLFDTTAYEVCTEPTPDELAGLGKDARATLRNARLIDNGTNPGTRLPLHANAATGREGDGLRCSGCQHLRRKFAHGSRFLKCDQTSVRPDVHWDGPDMRAWWPACTHFVAIGEGAS